MGACDNALSLTRMIYSVQNSLTLDNKGFSVSKKWLVLGSCRVVNTIAYTGNDAVVLNDRDLWFTHYPDEHMQKILHLSGEHSIPKEHKELFVRFEQQNHYSSHSKLRVGDSIETGKAVLQDSDSNGALNVAIELPTLRYIKVPTDDGLFWGHITNIDLIRNSPFNQSGGFYTDEAFLDALNKLEQAVTGMVSSSGLANSVNFIYVPHNPFIELKEGGWGLSTERAHIFELIRQHCSKTSQESKLQVYRCALDVKSMIEENGGVDFMLSGQNHYSREGHKVAYKYLNELALI